MALFTMRLAQRKRLDAVSTFSLSYLCRRTPAPSNHFNTSHHHDIDVSDNDDYAHAYNTALYYLLSRHFSACHVRALLRLLSRARASPARAKSVAVESTPWTYRHWSRRWETLWILISGSKPRPFWRRLAPSDAVGAWKGGHFLE